MCRSRRELLNAYLLAKFGFDTAENYRQPASRERALSSFVKILIPECMDLSVKLTAQVELRLTEDRELRDFFLTGGVDRCVSRGFQSDLYDEVVLWLQKHFHEKHYSMSEIEKMKEERREKFQKLNDEEKMKLTYEMLEVSGAKFG